MSSETFRIIPREVKVLRWTGDNYDQMKKFLIGIPHIAYENAPNYSSEAYSIYLLTHITRTKVNLNEFVVKHEDGFATCYSEKLFYSKYERTKHD